MARSVIITVSEHCLVQTEHDLYLCEYLIFETYLRTSGPSIFPTQMTVASSLLSYFFLSAETSKRRLAGYRASSFLQTNHLPSSSHQILAP